MPRWFTDFSTDTPGQLPVGWTNPVADAFASWQVVVDGLAPSGQSLRCATLAQSGGTNRSGVLWDSLGNFVIAGANYVEVFSRFRQNPVAAQGYEDPTLLLGYNAGGNFFGGWMRSALADDALNKLMIQRTAASLAAAAPSHTVTGAGIRYRSSDTDVEFGKRLRISPDGNRKGKFWRWLDGEPGAWAIDAAADGVGLPTGKVGLGVTENSAATNRYFEWFSIGFGVPAPSVPLVAPTQPVWITPEVNSIVNRTGIPLSIYPSTDSDGVVSGYIWEYKIGAGAWVSLQVLDAATNLIWNAPVATLGQLVTVRVKAQDDDGLQSAWVERQFSVNQWDDYGTLSGLWVPG
jgi:hypothetical protein